MLKVLGIQVPRYALRPGPEWGHTLWVRRGIWQVPKGYHSNVFGWQCCIAALNITGARGRSIWLGSWGGSLLVDLARQVRDSACV